MLQLMDISFFFVNISLIIRDTFFLRSPKDRSSAEEGSKEERKAGKVPTEKGHGGEEKDTAPNRGRDD